MHTLTVTDIDVELDEFDSDGAFVTDTPNDVWTQARCRDGNGTLTHLFFSDEVHLIARAKAICAKCPVKALCLDGALARAEPWGVWGGELMANGRIVVHKRPRGRPPKHPRPELVIDEVPIPPHLLGVA